VLGALCCAIAVPAHAGGPLGIDHRLEFDDSGIWNRHSQNALVASTWLVVVGGSLWEGDGSRLGHTFWQSFDSLTLTLVTTEVMKRTFSRSRPSQTDDPDRWFQGRGHNSFPSGEVASITTAITPFVLEYGSEHPAVWALELLPLYDGVARMKVWGHWQTDVLASLAIGTALGAYAHSRPTSISVGLLPHGVTIGWKTRF
jgi:undecaprenyl-diphosphatase